MSRPVRKHQRRQPYAWLGAGAVTVGLGVSLASGTAVAFADTDTAPAPDPTTPAATTAASTSAPAAGPRKRAGARAASALKNPAGSDQVAPGAALSPRARVTLPAATLADVLRNGAAPAATQAPVRVRAARAALAQITTTLSTVGPAAALVNPAASVTEDPTWLPGGPNSEAPGGINPGDPIVPGAHVQLALQEIASTQAQLMQSTFGAGNIFAGLVSVVPQLLLASAALSINAWGATTPAAQNFVAAVAGIPLITQVAQVSLLSTMALPVISDASMGLAALLMPVVGLFGADVAGARETLGSARQDGKIYAVVPVRMALGTQPLINTQVGGSRNTLLVDTGASGLLTTADRCSECTDSTATGVTGSINFSGNESPNGFHYTVYNVPVRFGGGAVAATAPVDIVDGTCDDADCTTWTDDGGAAFKSFLSVGGRPYADGILGAGANRYAGPGPAPIPTAVLPGELSDGFLLYESALPFGIGGFMVFGPNLMPTRTSVPGMPDAVLNLKVADGTVTTVNAVVDSGGVTGTIPLDVAQALDPTLQVGDFLPAGTRISVYGPDGTTLLYSYRTTEFNSPIVVAADDEMNTGYTPFNKGPVYVNYGYQGDNVYPYGIGSTDFAIW